MSWSCKNEPRTRILYLPACMHPRFLKGRAALWFGSTISTHHRNDFGRFVDRRHGQHDGHPEARLHIERDRAAEALRAVPPRLDWKMWTGISTPKIVARM